MIEYSQFSRFLVGIVLTSLSLSLAGQANPGTDLGSVNVGSAKTTTITVTIPVAATLGILSVRTQGSENLDFTDGGGGTCAVGAAYSAQSTCTVSVAFTPRYPGPRYGAAVLFDSTISHNPIATAYLQGTGQGAQIIYPARPWEAAEDLGSVPIYPQTDWNSNSSNGGLAFEGSGNIYVASAEYNGNYDNSNFGVTKWTLSNGSYAQSTISPTGGPGMAVDGAGSLYYGCGSTVCKAVPLSNGSYANSRISGGFNGVFGVAVDGGGNVYVVDNGAGVLWKETLQADGSYLQSEIASGLTQPTGGYAPFGAGGVAVDGTGNVYVVDQSQAIYKESPTGSGYAQTTIDNSLFGPVSVAVDRIGNVYVADENYFYYVGIGCDNAIASTGSPALFEDRLQPAGNYIRSLIGNPSSPDVVAFDASGNLYLVDTGIDYANACQNYGEMYRYKPNNTTAPSLDFGPVLYGAAGSTQRVTVSNSGTSPLTISSVEFPAGFVAGVAAKGDCKVGAPVASGGSCSLAINFKPTTPLGGNPSLPFSGSVTFNSNSVIGSQQNISVAGTEVPPVVAAPVFSPPAGNYANPVTVSITDSTPNTRLFYTLNGTQPTTSSIQYTGPIVIRNSYTLEVLAVTQDPYATTGFASGTYKLIASAPVMTPAGGVYATAAAVTITSQSSATHVYYTINGSAPSSAAKLYSGPVTVGATETLKAIAIGTGYTSSPVSTQSYVIVTPAAAPTFSPNAGIYHDAQNVTISDSTPAAAIYYTLNGTAPTTASMKYSGPVAVRNSRTLKAIAVASPVFSASAVGTAVYSLAVGTPVLSPAGGTYSGQQTITITTASAGATIYYTTNGSLPTASSPKYAGPVPVSTSETIRALAVETGYAPSPVVTEVYSVH